MRGLEHLSFDDSYNMANMVTIEDVIVPFIHLSHLIQNKKAINRTKDKVDVEYLEKIKQFKKNDDSI